MNAKGTEIPISKHHCLALKGLKMCSSLKKIKSRYNSVLNTATAFLDTNQNFMLHNREIITSQLFLKCVTRTNVPNCKNTLKKRSSSGYSEPS